MPQLGGMESAEEQEEARHTQRTTMDMLEKRSQTEASWCASVAKQADEPYIGTAPKAEVWCLLEYTGRWNEYAVKESALSPAVLGWLEQAQKHLPGLRVQFIKQHERPLQSVTCFIAITREQEQRLYRFTLPTYEALLQLDLEALVSGDARYASSLTQETLFLVCTHGKHDRCCAKFGLPIFQEVTRLVGEQAWQVSHVGGDHFAANLVCLPQGSYYGHVTQRAVSEIITACQHQQLVLDGYRGRCCYTAVVQAADFFLRKKTHVLDLAAFQLRRVETLDKHTCQVTFASSHQDQQHHLIIQIDPTRVTHYSVCKGQKTENIAYYRLREYICETPDREDELTTGLLVGPGATG